MTRLSLILLLLPLLSFGQPDKIEHILNAKVQLTDKISVGDNENAIFFKSAFASSDIGSPSALIKTQDRVILKVELVFTTFRSVQTFDQIELNRKRLYALKKAFPEIFKDDMIEWQLTGQTACTFPAEGNEFFHGFVIYYRKPQTIETARSEIRYLDRIAASISLVGTKERIQNHKKSTWDNWQGFGIKSDTASHIYAKRTDMPNFNFKDSTVLNVFKRNKKWNKMLVVSDVTGSMSSYTAQIIVWNKLTADQKKVNHFVFFNDGDNMSDKRKKMGSTEGIYFVNGRANDLFSTIMQAMLNGQGGDVKENDIEAIIKGMEKCTDCEDILLIADNRSNMRDLSMWEDIGKPVKVILCGPGRIANLQYLQLARKTGGSIHTTDQDILNLAQLNEGGEVVIGNVRYTLKDNRFVPKQFVHWR